MSYDTKLLTSSLHDGGHHLGLGVFLHFQRWRWGQNNSIFQSYLLTNRICWKIDDWKPPCWPMIIVLLPYPVVATWCLYNFWSKSPPLHPKKHPELCLSTFRVRSQATQREQSPWFGPREFNPLNLKSLKNKKCMDIRVCLAIADKQDEAHISKCIKCMYTKTRKSYEQIWTVGRRCANRLKTSKSSKFELVIQTSFNRLACAQNPKKTSIITLNPIGSMYGIPWYTSIWLIFVVNVGKYTNPMDPIKMFFRLETGYLKVRALDFLPSATDEFGPHKRTASSGELLAVSVDCHRFDSGGSAMRFHEFGSSGMFFWWGGGFIDILNLFLELYQIQVHPSSTIQMN